MLTAAQVRSLAAHATGRSIIIFKNRLSNLPLRGATMQPRVSALKAVQFAESVNSASPQGSPLLVNKTALNATVNAGQTHTFSIGVTNEGSKSQTVTPAGRSPPGSPSPTPAASPKTTSPTPG